MNKRKIIEAIAEYFESERGQKTMSDAIDRAMWRILKVEEFDDKIKQKVIKEKPVNILDMIAMQLNRNEGAMRGVQEDMAKHLDKMPAAVEYIRKADETFLRFIDMMNKPKQIEVNHD